MITKIFSLIKPLYVRSGYILFKCCAPRKWGRCLKFVSSMLMGLVLAVTVMQPLTVNASDGWLFRPFWSQSTHDTASSYTFTLAPESVEMITSDTAPTIVTNDWLCHYKYKIPVTIYRNVSASGTYSARWEFIFDLSMVYRTSSTASAQTFYPDKVYIEGLDNYTFRQRGSALNNSSFVIQRNINEKNIIAGSPTVIDNFYIVIEKTRYVYVEPISSSYLTLDCSINMNSQGGFFNLITQNSDSVNIKDIADTAQDNLQQDKEYHDRDEMDAEQAGSDMTGFASQLDNLKNTWSILWYPIEFTNRFIQVFVGGTQSAAYEDEYQFVSGYRYNDETGFLEPIMARTVQPISAGTGITFPAFSLMGYQIWDSYTYDLSQVKDQLPVVFDALYVIISILEMLWFVGYLRKKYEEVFG